MNRSYNAWLQFEPVNDPSAQAEYRAWCAAAAAAEDGAVFRTAVAELRRGLTSMLGIEPAVAPRGPGGKHIVVGTAASDALPASLRQEASGLVSDEGFLLRTVADAEGERIAIAAKTERGVLYGAYALLRTIALGRPISALDEAERPSHPIRMLNHWDNMDGSIERGYAGRSFFYENGRFVSDLGRIRDYARLLASVGINGLTINNVNVHATETKLIGPTYLGDVAKVAAIFREYGVKLYLSVNFASPMRLGGLASSDPLDPAVRAWWKDAAAAVYDAVPDFGGFVVKADSEGQPGPFAYGRDHADGANMLAEALAPHGGVVFWRCFVYNCKQDWRDRKTDRARAAYDHFTPLDGRFLDNVYLQIKNGPMDFQVREPVSPLFGAMDRTRKLMEFQITQEYTGQQKHLCYLVPQWKEALDFDTYAEGEGSPVHRRIAGFAAVPNVGNDGNWTGHLLAQANWYGYGRLTWNPGLTSEAIADEWARLTFGADPRVSSAVSDMLLRSWPIYESYTAPLGVGWMVNPNHHYGPNVDGYEYSVWGTYHYADRDGVGVDRSAETGTGYALQYREPHASRYNSPSTCPDELLLFFHHVPYTHRLHSGKTVIQHIYDSHFDGAREAEGLVERWRGLEGLVDEERYAAVLDRLMEQAEHAKEWRDQINTYFYRKSGIPDDRKRTIY